MTQPTSNGVTYKEVTELVNKATERLEDAIRNGFEEIRREGRESDAARDLMIRALYDEVYGKGNTPGLRTEVADLKRNTTTAHVFQGLASAALAAVLTALGLKQ